jgi:glycogen debranching enzyme
LFVKSAVRLLCIGRNRNIKRCFALLGGAILVSACNILSSGAQQIRQVSAVDELVRPDKTELTDAFSNVATTGSEFGLPWMWWWHRINAGWGTVRPEVARLVVFDERLGQAVWLQGGARIWKPDHLHQSATLNDLTITEDKSVLGDSVADVLRFHNSSNQRHIFRLYFLGHPEPHSPGNPASRSLSISFDSAGNSLHLKEEKDYGRHYLPGAIKIDQRIGSSLPIAGWAIGTFGGDVEKFIGRDLGMGAFINDANLRRYVDEYSGDRFNYAFQINLALAPGETKDLTLATSMGTDSVAVKRENASAVANATQMIKDKDAEWRGYFENAVPQFHSPDEKLNRLWSYIWYVLRANSVRSGVAVKADFTVPTKYGYWGCYIWDSAFHALGQLHLKDPEVAKNTLRAILSIQYPNGFLPVNSGADAVEVNTAADGTYNLDPKTFYRYTESSDPYTGELEYRSPLPHQWGDAEQGGTIKVQEKTMIPILGVAAWQTYLATGDKNFLAEMYEHLSRYDDWLWRRRNTGDGLLVYYNPEESGWDNAARLLPLPVKTVDGSTMVYLLREMLANSARVLKRNDAVAQFSHRAELTARSINEKMWDQQSGFFYDLSMDDTRRPQKSPAGFTPLMASIVSDERVARLAEHLRDPKEFATPAPVPSVSADDPDYDTRTWGWNGPSWIPSNWLVMESLARASMTVDSNRLMEDMEDMMSKPSGWPGAYEQYDSKTGLPFGVADYSWSGAINDYLVTWVAGVHPSAAQHTLTIAPHLLAGWSTFELRQLRIGQNIIGYRLDESETNTRLQLSNDGPDDLRIEFVLSEKQTPHKLLFNGTTAASDAWRVQDGFLHLVVEGHGKQTIEVMH